MQLWKCQQINVDPVLFFVRDFSVGTFMKENEQPWKADHSGSNHEGYDVVGHEVSE